MCKCVSRKIKGSYVEEIETGERETERDFENQFVSRRLL